MKKHMRSRKGISLAEVAVALVIISVVSLSTLTVVMMSANVEKKTVVALEVRNSAEIAIECFRFADGNEDVFIECLNETITLEEQKFAPENGDYRSKADKYTVTIMLLKELKEQEQETVVGFTYRAVNEANEEVYAFTFRNGGVQE